MDLLRTFFEAFLQEIAKGIEARIGNPAPIPGASGVRYFASFREYITAGGLLEKDADELLQRLYNYLSNVGSHSLGSDDEQFYVARTSVIEWCMLIAGRAESLVSQKSP